MTINISNFKWNGTLSSRHQTEYIILHHRAGNGDVQSIHNTHIANGWAGIGYHFYIRKDGNIYSGRPIETVGAHCSNHNSNSIGVCFEGNFEREAMSNVQIKAGRNLITYLKQIYPNAQIKQHKDFQNTSCPGKNFPFNDIKKGEISTKSELTTVNDIVWELNHRGIITNKNLWIAKCVGKSNAYWLAYKIANYTVNLEDNSTLGLSKVNDIVWELHHRGIITNKELWLTLLPKDTNLYWLAYKAANRTKNR